MPKQNGPAITQYLQRKNRLNETEVLVDVNHLRLLADLPEGKFETFQRSTRKNQHYT